MKHKLKELGKIARNPGWLCVVWIGMTAGISLLEAPVTFSAPTLKLRLLLAMRFRALMSAASTERLAA